MIRRPQRRKAPQKQSVERPLTIAAPLRGWNTKDPVANMPPGYARELVNWRPTPTNVQLREGATDFATDFDGPVKSVMVWSPSTGGPDQVFGATDTGIYDATAGGTVSPVSVAALTEGYCHYINFTTVGGSFLLSVNGTDQRWQYNGTTWTQTASFAISGGGTLNTTDIAFVAVAQRRVWYIKKNSSNAYYHDTNLISGDVSLFPFGGLFSQGGYLMSMTTWTVDGGAGADDYTVFASSKGQVAVYRGTDPSNSTTWEKVGLFDMAEPLGRKCFCQYGGEVIYLSVAGAFPLAQTLTSSIIQRSTALSDTVGPSFAVEARTYQTNFGWEAIPFPARDVLLINIPQQEFETSVQYVMNTKTKAWCLFSGWDLFALAVSGNKLYAGMNGKIAQLFNGLSDFGEEIQASAKGSFEYFAQRASGKHIKLFRPNLIATGQLNVQAGFDTDFVEYTAYTVLSYTPLTGSLWDVAEWDVDLWQANAFTNITWHSVECAAGYCHAFRLYTSTKDATIAWSVVDILFEDGGPLG